MLIVRPAAPDDYTPTGELVAGVFARGDRATYERLLQNWLDYRPREPGFACASHRVGLLDGQIVAHARVRAYTLAYGRARLRVGGIAEVCTRSDQRRQGHSARVLQDAITTMAEQGAHLGLLNGISSYYDRFGFNPVWPFYTVDCPAGDAAALPAPLRLRDMRPDDAPALAALYHRHWEGRVSFTRGDDLWAWRVTALERPMKLVAVDDRDTVHGYAAGFSLADIRIEVVVDTPEAALTLLAAGGAACREAGRETLRWYLPPDDALISFARQYLAVGVSARYLPRGGWMARLIDARGLIQTLLPEIIAQAASVDPHFDPDALLLDPHPNGVRIGLRRRDSTLCQLNYQDFIQVLFGSLRPAALAVRPYSRLCPEAVRLLDLLFPPRLAVLGGWDWF